MGGTVPSFRGASMESVLYTLPEVSRDVKKCPVCHQVFLTNHWMCHHMDIHKGMGNPCSKCHKSLAMRKTLWQHKKACIQGLRHVCGECQKSYASIQILKQHTKVVYGLGHPGVSHCNRPYRVKKSMCGHAGAFPRNPHRKGPYFCRIESCPQAHHAFQRIKSLNTHMSSTHSWKEHKD